MLKPLPFVALAMFGCVACTVLSSKTIDDLAEADRKPSGTFYSLPLGVMEFTLSVVPQKAAFTLSAGPVTYVPDPAHRYYLQYRPLPNYDDVITVKTDSRSFLTSVSATTTDQTPNIVVNVAKTLTVLGALEAAILPEDSITLAKVTIDPTDPIERENAIKALNAKIAAYANTATEMCGYYDGGDSLPVANPAKCAKNKMASASDIALFRYRCILKGHTVEDPPDKPRPPGTEYDPTTVRTDYEERIRSLTVAKQVIDARIVANAPNTTLGTTSPQWFSCKYSEWKQIDRPENDQVNIKSEKLCRLLREQVALDKKLKTLGANLDRINGKIAEIHESRNSQKAYCKQYAKFAASPPTVKMRMVDYREVVQEEVDRSDTPPPAQPWHWVLHRAQDCSSGICYRPKEPYKIVFGITVGNDSVSFDTVIVELPNRASPVLVDIRRAFFVKKVQEIQFDKDGFLTNVHINKPSELLAVSKLPLDILDAVLDGFKIRVGLLNKQRDIARKEAALLDAQAKLYGTRVKLESASTKTESSLETAPVRPIRGGATSW